MFNLAPYQYRVLSSIVFFLSFGSLLAQSTIPDEYFDESTGTFYYKIDEGGEEPPTYFQTYNENSSLTISLDPCRPDGDLGLDLTGDGITVGVWDAGRCRNSHAEFGDRVSYLEEQTVLSNDNHATHVIGTIAASGVQADARGMASEVLVENFNWKDDFEELSEYALQDRYIVNQSYGISTGWAVDQSGNPIWRGDVFVSTVEDYHFGSYSQRSKTLDSIIHKNPQLLVVRAAGNDRTDVGPTNGLPYRFWDPFQKDWVPSTEPRLPDGPLDCISHGGLSKNVLTIGAIDDLPDGYTTPGEVVLTSFSSVGPVDDGRIKPDLVANGLNVISTLAMGDDSYGVKSGTSMAAPAVSGAVALLQEHAQNVLDKKLLAAEMKGLLIHTADEAGMHPGPDYFYGWGVPNIARAADVISNLGGEEHQHIYTSIEGDEINSIFVDGSQPLKITLTWTDPEGAVLDYPPTLNDPTPSLVNNMDLLLFDPVGTTHFPYVLDPENPFAAAATGTNIVDNVEQIYIENPVPGEYFLQVFTENILANGAQDVSIFISGTSSNCPEFPNIEADFEGLSAVFTLTNFPSTSNTFVEWSIDGMPYNPLGTQSISYTATETSTHEICIFINKGGCDPISECLLYDFFSPDLCANPPIIFNDPAFGQVSDISLTTEGNPVFVYGNALGYYNGADFSFYFPATWGGSESGFIYDLEVDNNNNWWLSTSSGLFLFDGNNWSNIDETVLGFPLSENIWQITSGGDKVYFVLPEWELIIFENDSYSLLSIPDMGYISSASAGEDGILSFGTQTGIWDYIPATGDFSQWENPGIFNVAIQNISLGNNEEMLIYTAEQQLILHENNQTTIVDGGNCAYEILDFVGGVVLPDGRLYTGYWLGGLFGTDKSGENVHFDYPEAPFDQNYSISALQADQNGNMWVGSQNTLAFIPFEYENPVCFETPQSLCLGSTVSFENLSPISPTSDVSWSINGVQISNEWDLTLELNDPFFRVDLEITDLDGCTQKRSCELVVENCVAGDCETSYQIFPFADIFNGFDNAIVTGIAQAQNGAVYVSTFDQGIIQKPYTWNNFSKLNVPGNNPTYCVAVDDFGSPYFGSDNKIYRITNGNLVEYTAADIPGMPANFKVTDIELDKHGNLWFALAGAEGFAIKTPTEWLYINPEIPATPDIVNLAAGPFGEMYVNTDFALYIIPNYLDGNPAEYIADLSSTEMGSNFVNDMFVSEGGTLYLSNDSKVGTFQYDFWNVVNFESQGIQDGNYGEFWSIRNNFLSRGNHVSASNVYTGPQELVALSKEISGSIWLSDGTNMIQYKKQNPDFQIALDKEFYCAGDTAIATIVGDIPEGSIIEMINGFDLVVGNNISTYLADGNNYGIEAFIFPNPPECERFLYREIFVDGDCVWPGDMDKDGQVTNFDVLHHGIALDNTGPTRLNATTNWEGQSARNFDQTIISGINSKHADADGNTIVNDLDLQVINDNYMQAQPGLSDLETNAPPVSIDLPTDILEGLPFTSKIEIGDENTSVAEMYGIAFSLFFNGQYDDVNIDFSNSIFEMGEYQSFVREYADRLDVAVYMIAPTALENVKGELCRLTTIMVIDNVGDDSEDIVPFNIEVGNLSVLDANYNFVDLGMDPNTGNTGNAFIETFSEVFEGANDNIEACINEPIFLNSTTISPNYEWYLNGQKIEDADDPWLATRAEGAIQVVFLDENLNSTGDETFQVVRKGINKPEILHQDGTLICSITADQYDWFFNGALINENSGPNQVLEAEGYYAVKASSNLGCFKFSDSFYYTSDSVYLNTGLQDLALEKQLQVFPNPANNEIQISLSGTQMGVYWIENLEGKQVLEGKINAKDKKINVRALLPGMYSLNVSSENEFHSQKIVVTR